MAVENILPNGDKVAGWETANKIHGETYHYECLDEYPSATDGSYVSDTNISGSGSEESFYMATLSDVDEVTSIVVYTNGSCSAGNNDPSIDISLDNGENWEGSQTCNLNVATGTVTNTFNGSWNQSELDNLIIKYISDVAEKGENNIIQFFYVKITYTIAVAGYTHDFMGIPSANIDSVNGIPSANIDTIKGV